VRTSATAGWEALNVSRRLSAVLVIVSVATFAPPDLFTIVPIAFPRISRDFLKTSDATWSWGPHATRIVDRGAPGKSGRVAVCWFESAFFISGAHFVVALASMRRGHPGAVVDRRTGLAAAGGAILSCRPHWHSFLAVVVPPGKALAVLSGRPPARSQLRRDRPIAVILGACELALGVPM